VPVPAPCHLSVVRWRPRPWRPCGGMWWGHPLRRGWKRRSVGHHVLLHKVRWRWIRRPLHLHRRWWPFKRRRPKMRWAWMMDRECGRRRRSWGGAPWRLRRRRSHSRRVLLWGWPIAPAIADAGDGVWPIPFDDELGEAAQPRLHTAEIVVDLERSGQHPPNRALSILEGLHNVRQASLPTSREDASHHELLKRLIRGLALRRAGRHRIVDLRRRRRWCSGQ